MTAAGVSRGAPFASPRRAAGAASQRGEVEAAPEPIHPDPISGATANPVCPERFEPIAFKASFAVVQVGDARPYGCFLFRKGVIAG